MFGGMCWKRVISAWFSIAGVFSAGAFNPPEAADGPLTVRLSEPGEIVALEKPVALTIHLKNSGDVPLSGRLRVWVIDDWRLNDRGREERFSFAVPAAGASEVEVFVTPGAGTYAALYPVHAKAEAQAGSAILAPHAILLLNVTREAVAAVAKPATQPTLRFARILHLDDAGIQRPGYAIKDGPPENLPVGWQGSDKTTGTSIGLQDVDRGERRRALAVHPPWRGGWGETWCEYRVALPAAGPLALEFATAIRDHSATEPASDGVQFRVLADGGAGFKELFSRFSDAKVWEPASVDLDAFAGKTIRLRLQTGPGPRHNTVCDQAFWAEPMLRAGTADAPESESSREQRRKAAIAAARAALAGRAGAWAWRLKSEAGAAVVVGPAGFADAMIAFVAGDEELVIEGFAIEIDGRTPVWGNGAGAGASFAPDTRIGAIRRRLPLLNASGEIVAATVETKVWAEEGALRVRFSMPGVTRDLRGTPRFTNLQPGPASQPVRRIFAGFGNVLEEPGRLEIRAGGFHLSARHAGVDFANGLSLVQASDVFPDAFTVDPEKRLGALRTHHDATFSFIPSSRGAFAAARAYRRIAGFQPGPGVERLLGRMCLDQWGGDYRKAADDLAKAARYGLNDAIFVKHVWQRWGYDYRLPDIYPPNGAFEDFQAMVSACHEAGILFCPHDNYIDFYPDASGFSYEHIIFNPDGTPQRAWFNRGREAQSYRWLPTAFAPWQEANLRMMEEGFAPDALFIDVFSAIAPMDFRDRAGRFHPKSVSQAKWGEAFDRAREVFGDNAPQLSEAGTDALIGHLDGGQSDHAAWQPPDAPRGEGLNAAFRWNYPAADGERVPWHDMATHGAFVLFGGGLGPRYAGGTDGMLHGYGSDDYLTTTVMGGRNPMCDGPFSRRAVMTGWLLQEVCARLARSEMLEHRFADDDIHRQIVRFGAGEVIVNRGRKDWNVGGAILPRYGFIARAGEAEASVIRRDGVIVGFSRAPGVLFADARPMIGDGAKVRPWVTAVEQDGSRVRLRLKVEILEPVPDGYRPFLHFSEEHADKGEGIVFQGHVQLDLASLSQAGEVEAVAEARLPGNPELPATVAIRFGLYRPKGGSRLRLAGPTDATGRAKGGRLHLAERDGSVAMTWEPEPPDPVVAEREARLNLTGRMVNFGPVATDGAFRLRHADDEWELLPLPRSRAARVVLDLARLGTGGRRVVGIREVDEAGAEVGAIDFAQEGNRVSFRTPGESACRLRFAGE